MAAHDFLRIHSSKRLADDWGILTKYDFELKRRDGSWQRQSRETYDRGNGATCLLHNPSTNCVLLTRQFRLPTFVNGGLASLTEAPAGLLEGADPADRMRAELIEETGFAISKLDHLFDIYMSPGTVTEYLAFFLGEYRLDDQIAEGGGNTLEGEDIEVLHVPLDQALQMIRTGEIKDAKTVILIQHLALHRMTVAKGNQASALT